MTWRPIGATPAALVNTGGILDAASAFDPATGFLEAVYASHISTQQGYQNANLARWTVPVADVLSAANETIDWEDDELLLMIDGPGRGHLLNEDGVFLGLFDSATVDVNLGGGVLAWRCSTTSVDVAGRLSAAGITPFINNRALDGLMASIRLGFNGTDYTGTMGILGRVEGSNRWELVAGTTVDTLRGSTIDNWVIGFGAWHGSTGNVVGVLQTQRLLWAVNHQATKDAPIPDPAAKPATGGGSEIVIVVIGDSIGDGYGAAPTGDGSDGLAYGGAAIPAGVTVIDKGSTLTNWPDSGALAAPGPGVMPHLAEAALAAGYESVVIIRYAVVSAPTSAIHSTWLPALQEDLAAAGYLGADVHLVVNLSGTNDSQAGESVAFEGTCETHAEAIGGAFPNARLVWVGPGAVDDAGPPDYSDANEVRAFISTRMDTRTHWHYFNALGTGLEDDAHPDLQGFADIGDGAWALYVAGA